MSGKKFVAIRASGENEPFSLYFLDIIQDKYDWWEDMNTSIVREVMERVNGSRPSRIRCVIDSEGGDAASGIAIYNFLKAYDAEVEVEIIGLAGSIASVIAMAASPGKLRIARNAFMMIHKAWGVAAGTGEEIRQGADLVDKFTGQIVDIYTQRTGKTSDDINGLIAYGDYWMTGMEAVEQGFADETFNDNSSFKVSARLRTLDPNYQNIPAFALAHDSPFINQKFDDMKQFIKNMVDRIAGVKPEPDADQPTVNALVAEALREPLEGLATEIEQTIDNKVTEGLKSFALADGENLGGLIGTLKADIKALQDKNVELENAIANKSGNPTHDSTPEPKRIGTFN